MGCFYICVLDLIVIIGYEISIVISFNKDDYHIFNINGLVFNINILTFLV